MKDKCNCPYCCGEYCWFQNKCNYQQEVYFEEQNETVVFCGYGDGGEEE